MERPALLAPNEWAHEQSHTTIFRGPHPIAFNPRTDLEAIGTLIRALHQTHRTARLTARQLRLLLTLAALTNGKHFRATGEMVCWPGEVALADALGLKHSSNIYRMVDDLQEAELVERTTIDVDGVPRAAYRLFLPEQSSDGARPASGTVRARRGMSKSAHPNWMRAGKSSAHPIWKGSTIQSGRARKSDSFKELNMEEETAKSSSSSTPPVPTEPDRDGRSAAAAAELELRGIDDPELVRQLVALETTTRENVLAWWLIAEKKPTIRDKTGFVIKKLLKGERPDGWALKEARRRLNRPAPRELAATATDHPGDPEATREFLTKHEQWKKGKQKVAIT